MNIQNRFDLLEEENETVDEPGVEETKAEEPTVEETEEEEPTTVTEQEPVVVEEEPTVEATEPVVAEEEPTVEEPVVEEPVVITLSNELNSAKHNPPGFSLWVGGKERGDTQNGAVKLNKTDTSVSLTITPEVLVDGNLLTWYYSYGWYSNASIIGPFKTGDTLYVPAVQSNDAKTLFSMFDPRLIPSKHLVKAWGYTDCSICHTSLSLRHFFSLLPTVFWPNFFQYLEEQGISRSEFDDARSALHALPVFTPTTLKTLLDKDDWESYEKAGSLVNYYNLYPDHKTTIEQWVNSNLINF